jgi:uncharacterized protein (DUF2141 family)
MGTQTARWGRRRGGRVGRALAGALLVLALPAAPASEPRGTLGVRVTGLHSDAGMLRFGLYDRKETFATDDGPVAKGARPIHAGRCEFELPDLPYGTYALIVGHDVNGDGHIDRSPFSPELKGISNYTGKVLWFPDFDRAKFRLDRPRMTIEVRVY